MKRLLVIILSLVLTLGFAAGCSETLPSGTGNSGTSSGGTSSGTTDSGTSSDIPEGSYVVTLQFPSGTAILPTLTDIYAIWSTDSSVYTAYFSSTGVAYIEGLDGEYTVTLSKTPDGYAYNPNIYEADGTDSGRQVTIEMYAIAEFEGGSGISPVQGYPATISLTTATLFRVYRITFNSANTEFYFTFTPPTSGIYQIETYVSTYDNTVNPSFKKYASTTYWTTYDSVTDGGESATYTKNVKCQYSLAPVNVGTTWLLSISVDTITGDYPVYVDFAVAKVGEYTDEELYAAQGGAYQSVEAPENIKAEGDGWTTPSGSYTMFRVSTLMNGYFSSTKVCTDGVTRTCVAYNEDDGFYYYNPNPTQNKDSEIDFTDGSWTLVFVKIQTTALFDTMPGLLQVTDSNARTYRVSVTENGVKTNLDYQVFLQAYQAAANSDSAYPVTKELMNCLYNISSGHQYFYDKKGTLELNYGYDANDEDQWLYACGVYI